MRDLHAYDPDVKTIQTGHLLRWLKQMALRGAGREFDDDGRCGKQKLVLTTDYALLIAHKDVLFPGATLEVHEDDKGHTSWLKKLAEVLRMTPSETSEVTTREVGDRLGVSWRDLSTNLRKQPHFNAVLAGAGWSYVPQGAIRARRQDCPRWRMDSGAGQRHSGALGSPPFRGRRDRHPVKR